MAAKPRAGPQTAQLGPDTEQRRASRSLPVSFSGSGSEYFRIWIVNLLLTLVTLGLYLPWARARRLRYFHGNTWVGDYALNFHGEPRHMLRGTLLGGLLLGVYSVAQRVDDTAGLVALLILLMVWPALFRASQQFRLTHTSWRGLRFQFDGGLGAAYAALLPLAVPLLMLLALGQLAPEPGAASTDATRPADDTWGWAFGAVLLSFPLLAPLLWWMLKKYQHDGYALGSMRASLRTDAAAFYGVALRSVLVALGPMVLAGALVMLLLDQSEGSRHDVRVMLTLFAVTFASYLVLFLCVAPYWTSRMQNLLWNRTKSTRVRFESRLSFRSLAWLQCKNAVLVVLTLGLYWPFARVALARLRLESVTVHTRCHPNELVARERERARAPSAAGDAVVDLVGFDIGL